MIEPHLTAAFSWNSLLAADFELAWVIIVAFGTLGAGTIIRLTTLWGRTDDKAVSRRNSLKTWWGVTTLVVGIVTIGRDAAIVVFALLSILSFLEFIQLERSSPSELEHAETPSHSARSSSHRYLVATAAILIPFHYLCLWQGQTTLSIALLPVGALLTGSVILVLTGQAKGYASQLGRVYLGLMFTTYFLSHVVMLFPTVEGDGSKLHASACFLYVITLTELDDITQALVGRRIGKHKLSPIVSPNKSWEGFLGGIVVTCIVSVILGHLLISSTWFESLVYGLIIAVAALFGDLNMSAFKRDAGVKDSGNWLPGHGGLLDRIDSLTFTAPVFYYVYLQPMST